MTRAVSRTTWYREPCVVEGRRREILFVVAHECDSRLVASPGTLQFEGTLAKAAAGIHAGRSRVTLLIWM